MAQSRTKPRYIHFMITFIKEYLYFREGSWGSYKQQALAFFGNTQNLRKTEVQTTLDEITSLEEDDLDKGIKFITSLGERARQLQEKQYPLGSLSPRLYETDSLLAKTYHAVRTCYIQGILTSPKRATFLTKVQEIRNNYEAVKDTINEYFSDKKDPKILIENRRSLFFNLLDLQEKKAILFAGRHPECFPQYLPLNENIGIDEDNELNIHPSIPHVYHDNYRTIFYRSVIEPDQQRKNYFEKEILSFYKPSASQKKPTPDILDEDFFNISSEEKKSEEPILPSSEPIGKIYFPGDRKNFHELAPEDQENDLEELLTNSQRSPANNF